MDFAELVVSKQPREHCKYKENTYMQALYDKTDREREGWAELRGGAQLGAELQSGGGAFYKGLEMESRHLEYKGTHQKCNLGQGLKRKQNKTMQLFKMS